MPRRSPSERAPAGRRAAVRGDRRARRLGLLDDADVRRLELGLEARLLRPREQVLVELPVRLHLALEDAVVDRLAARAPAPRPSPTRGSRRAATPSRAPCGTRSPPSGRRCGSRRGASPASPDLRAHAHHVGVAVAERLREPRLLLLERAELDLQRLHGLAGERRGEALELAGRERSRSGCRASPSRCARCARRARPRSASRASARRGPASPPGSRAPRARGTPGAPSPPASTLACCSFRRSESQPVASVEVVKRSSSDCSM